MTDIKATARTIPCPDCGADRGRDCTENGFWVVDIHQGRIDTSQQVPF